ncbi:MAG: Asp-tRNA(Asn)/Glu-tRNA(Gln) amidotransferase subunit GatC [Candidatus Micrarchaeota archaeon]|nr:Asp-tRNA(Asn)/Glu-tRNA(Gln) amidotransferase subunit GatC [Candidatus Micrarchaeota archaeon]MDE1848263.1 Asp-tRNA(Asn)/Glu-tRNA(Gln) amidotransferase subunit GatC [Candidatus Micrarchaeota archaeon]MDE1864745.1 Asp-tRNA(Asn)/Glu-tRNA(Gln) amidotransferase subunit GatC [Candidatus Micrarchaeota archaeon]
MEDSDFDRLLKVCRLRLGAQERKRMEADITEIIGYFNTIDNAKVDDLEPSYHPTKISGKLREDKVRPFENPDQLLKGTKTHRFYVVGPDL